MELKRYPVEKDLVVAGAGFPGFCCALEAARLGLRVALINNRGYLGGNTSAEIRCPIDGADGEQLFNFFSRESGIIEEIRLRNLYLNPRGNAYRWDAVLLDFCLEEENLELFLNTHIDSVDAIDGSVKKISGVQMTTEKRFDFTAPLFVDATGDGTVAYLAGCGYAIGREGREAYSERIAPEQADDELTLSTMTYTAKDTGGPVEYIPPSFAVNIWESGALEHREIPHELFWRFVWSYEVGGGLHPIDDAEEILQEHRKLTYGVWDHVKNSREYPEAANYDLEFVSSIHGKRESRRITGRYVLRESDITGQRDFPDAVGYGGWAIDLHAPMGFYDKGIENRWLFLDGVYPIPLSSAIAAEVDNLFLVGRCFSTSHVAFGSTRLNATLATVGQGVAAAAAICKELGVGPAQVAKSHCAQLHALQQRLDHYVPGVLPDRSASKLADAQVKASSVRECALRETETAFALSNDIGLSLPLGDAQTLRLLLEAEEDTVLQYEVYTPRVRQNYGPDQLLYQGAVTLSGGGGFSWVDLTIPPHHPQESDYAFVLLKACEGVRIAVTTERLPGVMAVESHPNHMANRCLASTLQPAQVLWESLGNPQKIRKYSAPAQANIRYTPCFELLPSQAVYGPENVVNGFTRPYGRPNIWVSEAQDTAQSLTFSLPERRALFELELVLDTDLAYRIRNMKAHDFRVFPQAVRDYDVYVGSGDQLRLVGTVRGNYQRLNRLDLGGVEADTLRIDFLATNGAPSVGVYEVRAR